MPLIFFFVAEGVGLAVRFAPQLTLTYFLPIHGRFQTS